MHQYYLKSSREIDDPEHLDRSGVLEILVFRTEYGGTHGDTDDDEELFFNDTKIQYEDFLSMWGPSNREYLESEYTKCYNTLEGDWE